MQSPGAAPGLISGGILVPQRIGGKGDLDANRHRPTPVSLCIGQAILLEVSARLFQPNVNAVPQRCEFYKSLFSNDLHTCGLVMFISPRRLLTFAWRLRKRPLRVVIQKLLQYTNLWMLHSFGMWKRHERQARGRWNASSVRRFVKTASDKRRLMISAKGIEDAGRFLSQHVEIHERLSRYRDQVLQRQITVFESTYDMPAWDDLPWCEDWRFGHRWPNAFFRQYNFYEFDKPNAYDVKFPWELSRLNFVMIPTLLAVLEQDEQWPRTLNTILNSWRKANPFANSVNWYPMEAAMRGVNLAMLVSLLAHHRIADSDLMQNSLELCELHGRFIFRSIEYGEVRGNHFAAEIVALLLLGSLLRDEVPEARRWLEYAQQYATIEVLGQFLPDGIQFEKSTSYHRLVTELFLVAFVAMQKAGLTIDRDAHYRLQQACRYTKAYTRPDGLAPLWGDSDDAHALWFDVRHHRDHRPLSELAAAFFNDPTLTSGEICSIVVPLLLDRASCRHGQQSSSTSENENTVQYFAEGGMVCATYGENYFIADVGEVGLQRRGGHGHLDSLSFELTLQGVPLIIDPGSYIYTGDMDARNAFRSARAHNVVVVDDQEPATFFPRHMWRLGNESQPFDISFRRTKDEFALSARHDGYTRLEDPVRLQRVFTYHSDEERFTVTDHIECLARHDVERILHFPPGLEFKLTGRQLLIFAGSDRLFQVSWGPDVHARLTNDRVSDSYGQFHMSKTLQLQFEAIGRCELTMTVRPITQLETGTSDKMTLTPNAHRPTVRR